MDFTKINAIAEGLPTKKVADLDKNHAYRVTLLKKVNTRFGERVVAELGDDGVQIYLPLRVSDALLVDEEMYKILCDNIVTRTLFIHYINSCIRFNSS